MGMANGDGVGVVIVGGGPAGRAALARLPGARLVTRPALAWHAEPGRLWVEEGGVRAEPFATLLLCADEPLLLLALGCGFDGTRPVADEDGRTTVPGVFAAGRVLGASTAEQAEAQARRAAAAAILAPPGDTRAVVPARPVADGDLPDRLDPVALAVLLERSPGPARNAAVLAQGAMLGPVLPARPVGLAALAALTPEPPAPRPVQPDAGAL